MGGACGFLVTAYMGSMAESMGFGQYMLHLFILVLELYAAIFIELIIHEGGHLVFGLLSGYTFSSFRIGSLMFLKEDGKTRVCRLSLAGTGGQCLMCPPDIVDGRMPYVLYNLGGVIMNLVSAAVFLLIFSAAGGVSFVPGFCLIMAVAGVGIAVVNGVPMRLGTVDNDGYNALSLGKNPAALRSFWVQLKANEEIAKGTRLKDMPEEWFWVPDDEELKNSMVAVMAVFYENRLIDERRFSEAAELIDHLKSVETGIVGVHMGLLTCDRIYCELVGGGDTALVDSLLTKEQLTIMKQMKTNPTVLRTQYVMALLKDRDEAKAAELKKQFAKYAERYPYKSDVESELELMETAAQISKN